MSPASSSASRARRSRSARGTPWTSRPYPAFSSTLRCGKSAKCWKTMLIFCERTARRSAGASSVRSWPSKRTCPAVGSRSPFSMRSSVDLPEPESPMTTKIWPGSTEKEASITAAVVPSARSSSRSTPFSSRCTASSGRLPNTLYKCSACSLDTYTSRFVTTTARLPAAWAAEQHGSARAPGNWRVGAAPGSAPAARLPGLKKFKQRREPVHFPCTNLAQRHLSVTLRDESGRVKPSLSATPPAARPARRLPPVHRARPTGAR